MQKEISESMDLLNEKGELKPKGWARKMIFKLNREKIRANRLRVKDWDSYKITNEDYAMTFTVADIGYLGLGSVYYEDFKNNKSYSQTIQKAFPLGSLNLPISSHRGDIHFKKDNYEISFRIEGINRIIEFDYPEFEGGRRINGKFVLHQNPKNDTLVNAIPFKKKKHFVLAQKILCMPTKGTVNFGEKQIKFSENETFGLLDWSRGVFPYKTEWYWANACGRLNGKTLGFTLGYGFGDSSFASKNIVFFQGKGHKLGKVKIDFDEEDFLDPWKIKSNDNRLDLTLKPIQYIPGSQNLLILKTEGHPVYGYYSGMVELDNGEKLKIDRLFGFAEYCKHRW